MRADPGRVFFDDASGVDPLSDGLGPRAANYAPLTPASFLERAAAVYPATHAVRLIQGLRQRLSAQAVTSK
jgi:hypothetical protein